jgi:hypothetical protein
MDLVESYDYDKHCRVYMGYNRAIVTKSHPPCSPQCSCNHCPATSCATHRLGLNTWCARLTSSSRQAILLLTKLTQLLVPWGGVLPEKLSVAQLKKAFPAPRTERAGTLPCSHQSATGLYPGQNESILTPDCFNISFNTTLPSTSRSSMWPLPFRCFDQHFSPTRATRHPHPIFLDFMPPIKFGGKYTL